MTTNFNYVLENLKAGCTHFKLFIEASMPLQGIQQIISCWIFSTNNWSLTCFVAQKGRENPKTKGPQKDHEGRKALTPLSRNTLYRKDFHNARESLDKLMDTPEQNRSVKINTTKKSPSVKTPANYVPVWKRPLGNAKTPGGSPTQSPQRKAISSTHGNAPAGQVKCKVLRQPPMKFRLWSWFNSKVNIASILEAIDWLVLCLLGLQVHVQEVYVY